VFFTIRAFLRLQAPARFVIISLYRPRRDAPRADSGEGRRMAVRYIAFDVETPNHLNDRMSAIGITVIEDGEIVDDFFSLVNPEARFDAFNTQLTGIDANKVAAAPSFAALWETLEPLLSSGLLVAHNAPFDLGVLKKCLHAYGIAWRPRVAYACTVQMGRRLLPGMRHGLDVLCGYYGICLDHHQADSDSRACAEILLRYLRAGADVKGFIRTYRLE